MKFVTSFIENGQVKGRRPAGLEPNLSFKIVCNNASPPDWPGNQHSIIALTLLALIALFMFIGPALNNTIIISCSI